MLPKLKIRDTDICHITLEEVMCNELIEQASDDYISILKTVTNIHVDLNTSGSTLLECKLDAFESQLLKLKSMNFKVAVIWAEGSWPNDPDIDIEIRKTVQEWNKVNWGCAGHILDRDNNPQFHHQCVIINLEKFTHISNEVGLHEYQTSGEHMHDDYTPTWIMPTADRKRVKDCDPVKGLFNAILRTTLDKSQAIFNLDYNIRNHKLCIYPEDDIKWTEEQIYRDYSDLSIIYDVGDNYPDKKPLLELKMQSVATLYVTNTESVPHVDVNDVQVLVCPCSGLHQFKYMQPSLDVMEMVVWADYSSYAVKWMEILIHEWDGKNFHRFYGANKARLNFPGTFVHGYGTWEKFLSSFENEDEWLKVWGKIQNLEHQFEVVDLINEHDKIVNILPHNKTVLLQCSNIFMYESNYFTKGLDTTFNGISYVRKVQSISDKVYFNGDMNGNYYDITNIGRQKWI